MKIRALSVVLIVAGGVLPALSAPVRLSPTEIKTVFGTGMPFTASSATGSASFLFVLKPDGSASRTSRKPTGTVVTGTWRVDEKGYCTKWGSSTEQCYTVEKNGKRYDIRNAAGQLISHWSQ